MFGEIFGAAVVNEIVRRAMDRWPSLRTAGSRERALRAHFNMIDQWAADISIGAHFTPRARKGHYVELDLRPGYPQCTSVSSRQRGVIRTSQLINQIRDGTIRHILILGDPGAGKSTCLKTLASTLLEEHQNAKRKDTYIPLLVLLHRLQTRSLTDYLSDVLGLPEEQRDPRQLAGQLNREKFPALLFLDGLDELEPGVRQRVVQEIREVMLHLQDSRIVLTSRPGAPISLPHTQILSVQPLSEEKAAEFALSWLNNAREADDFLHKIHRSPYRGTELRPLTLTYLCAIYENDGEIPEEPRHVYKRILSMYLRGWDEERGIERPSRFGMSAEDKQRFLETLAFSVTQKFRRPTFSDEDLQEVYAEIRSGFGLPPHEGLNIAREVSVHTGLLQESANYFAFAHKSLHEFLAAKHMKGEGAKDIDGTVLARMPDEAAIVVSLSRDPADQFLEVVGNVLQATNHELPDFATPFLQRLQLERVVLSEGDADLGYTVLALVSSAQVARHDQLTLDLDPLSEPVVQFLKQPAICNAIRDYLQSSVIYGKDVDTTVRVHTRTELVYRTGSGVQDIVVRRDLLDTILPGELITSDIPGELVLRQ